MTPADRAIVAAAEERDREWRTVDGPVTTELLGDPFVAAHDRRELLRIVRALEALLRERDTQAEDRADDAAEREFLRPIR